MKHKIINSAREIYFDEYEKAKNYIEEINAKDIGLYLLEDGLLETTLTRTSNYESDKIMVTTNVVVMKTSDYENMMSYLKHLEGFVFYDKETSEETKLEDLI